MVKTANHPFFTNTIELFAILKKLENTVFAHKMNELNYTDQIILTDLNSLVING